MAEQANKSIPMTAPKILCVDDEPSILSSLSRLLRARQVVVLCAESGQEALDLLRQHRVHMIISDMRMPEMNGVEFLQQAMVLQPHAYRVLMTGYSDMDSTIAAINDAHINRYLSKPWSTADILSAVKEGLHCYQLHAERVRMQHELAERVNELKTLNNTLEAMVEERTKGLRNSLRKQKRVINQLEVEKRNSLSVLYNILSAHPSISARFASNVATLCAAIARKLNFESNQCKALYVSGLLHELGAIGLPTDLIEKPLHTLESKERQQFYDHVHTCELILSPALHLRPVLNIISNQYRTYKEMLDAGEPEDSVLYANILAVSRDYWMLIATRSTDRFISPMGACNIIKRGRGTTYAAEVVDALARCYKTSKDIFATTTKDGLATDQLTKGMQLRSDLFNENKLILLRKRTVLTDELIAKLKHYEQRQGTALVVDAFDENHTPIKEPGQI